jgi:hypothetical protein
VLGSNHRAAAHGAAQLLAEHGLADIAMEHQHSFDSGDLVAVHCQFAFAGVPELSRATVAAAIPVALEHAAAGFAAHLVKKLRVARDRASDRVGHHIEGRQGHTLGVAGVAWVRAGEGQTVLCRPSEAPHRNGIGGEGHAGPTGRPEVRGTPAMCCSEAD